MINVPQQNTLKEGKDSDTNSTVQDNIIDKNNTNNADQNVAMDNLQQFKPCGRSYSSAKALKDHIKTVHTDTTIYSCHVGIISIIQ